MSVATFLQTNYTGQSSAVYKAAIDGDIGILAILGDAFAPHAKATPDMTVQLEPGAMFLHGGAPIVQGLQTSATLTAPSVNNRIDRVVIDAATAVLSVIGGTESGSPVAPAIPVGKIPIGRILMTVGMVTVQNSAITDERTPDLAAPVVKGAAIASASTITLGAGNLFHITGTTTINTISGSQPFVILVADAAWTLSYNVATMILDNAVDYQPSAGDVIALVQDGSGNWRELWRRNRRWRVKAKTATYTLTTDDHLAIIKATSGTWTLSVSASSTLRDGFVCLVKNAGTGKITIVPNGAETIEGQASLVLAAGIGAFIFSDGANLFAFVTGVTLSGDLPICVWKFGALNMPQNVTRYATALGIAPQATESNAQITIPERCTLSQLRVHLNAAVVGGQSITVTVRKNGVDTALTVTISAGQTGSDLADAITFEQGDALSVKLVTSATFGSTTEVKITLVATKVDGSGAGVSAIWYFDFAGGNLATGEFNTTTEANVQVPLSACRVFTRGLTSVVESAAASAGIVPCVVSVRRNATTPVIAPSLYEMGINAFVGPFSVEGLPVEFAENDLFTLLVSGLLTTSLFSGFVRLAPLNPTNYAPCPILFTMLSQAQNTTRYMGSWVSGYLATVESEVQIPMPACTVKNLRAAVSAVPPAGQFFTVTVRKNGVATALTVIIDSTGRVQADTTHTVIFAAGDLLSIESVSSATTGTKHLSAGIEAYQ